MRGLQVVAIVNFILGAIAFSFVVGNFVKDLQAELLRRKRQESRF